MAVQLKIPEVGESITEVQISKWLKAEGDLVRPDEPVAVIESDKATFELPSPGSGRLAKILHPAGDSVNVGEVIGELEPADEAAAPSAGAAAKKETPGESTIRPQPIEPSAKAKSSPGDESEAGDGKKADAAPPAENAPAPEPKEPEDLAPREEEQREEGQRRTVPTGHDGDGDHSSNGREEEVVPMTRLRRTVARRLMEARRTMAALTTFNEADLTAVQALRREHGEAFEKRYGVRLGLLSFFVKAAIDGLKQFPQLNAEIRGDDIVYRNYFDIGVAIATDRGLVVPVLRNVERLSFAEVEKAIGEFAGRARSARLDPHDLEGGTFTITNGGVFGSLLSTPIINPPQSGILGLHAIQERPVAVDGEVVVRPMMYLALTYDHRLVDGREAVLFLRRVKEAVETPARMLLEV